MTISNVKSNKRKISIALVLVISILVFGAVGYAAIQNNNVARLLGIEQAKVLSSVGNDIVATIDGEKITIEGFDTYKLFLNSSEGNKLSDQQILDKILDRQVVYKQAIKEGMTASEEEVNLAIKSAQEAIELDSKQYEAFKEYISGLKLSEDEYWETVKPAYKKALTCGKYKNVLKEKYKEENNIQDAKELNSKFIDFYNQKVKELKSNIKVESFLK